MSPIHVLPLLAAAMPAAGPYFEVRYPPPEVRQPGVLAYGVNYTVWIPPGVKTLRGVIVHQHGCGVGACKGGETAAYDLHWQALARKWDCALFGPSYQQPEGQDCRLWCDPRNGSRTTFLRALADLGAKSGHPELERVPWCLWGHSGGGFWASLMQASDPERVVAVWCRSGTAFATWEKGDIAKPELTAAVYRIPLILNPGAREKDDKRFRGAWDGSLAMFLAYRVKGAPVGFVPDPRTAHECGDSRYLAIPFFDACLEQRLPNRGATDQKLKTIPADGGWLADLHGDKAVPAANYHGKPEQATWLPSEAVAKAWADYIRTGAVGDTTPPLAPTSVTAEVQPNGSISIRWEAVADFESGLQGFVIQRDGKEIGQVPEKPAGRFGRPLFQSMSYHDTPNAPLPEMRFVDRNPIAGRKHEYRVIAVNSVGLLSAPSSAVEAK